MIVGGGKGAQKCVLIKKAEAMEKMAEVDTVIVDKTGTITEWKPTFDHLGTFSDAYASEQLLQYVVSVNANSEHPLAQATVQFGKENNVEILKTKYFNAVSGMGVEGKIKDTEVHLGNLKLMEKAHVDISNSMKEEVKKSQEQGKTVSFLAIDGVCQGYVSIGYKINETSAKAIKAIQDK